MSKKINECKTGCIYGLMLLNDLIYADDLVIFINYSVVLKILLNISSKYGIEFDIKYNAT